MDLTFNTKMEAYYQKFFELQEKLRKSEEERLKLEMKFNELVQVSREEEQAHYKKLRSQYKKFMEEDKKRQDRNEKIIRTLERIESRVNMLSSKTERIKMLRRQYQNYLQRVSRTPADRREYFPPKLAEELPNQEPKSSCDISVLKKAFGKTNDEKIEILDKYLQSLKSQKDPVITENKPRETNARDGFNEMKYFDEVSKKLNEGFNSNEANSIAEEIMNSIYARHYKTDLVKNEPKKISKFTASNLADSYTEKTNGFGDIRDDFKINKNNYSSNALSTDTKKNYPNMDYVFTNVKKGIDGLSQRPYTLSKDVTQEGLVPNDNRTQKEEQIRENIIKSNKNLLPMAKKSDFSRTENEYQDIPRKAELDLMENEKQMYTSSFNSERVNNDIFTKDNATVQRTDKNDNKSIEFHIQKLPENIETSKDKSEISSDDDTIVKKEKIMKADQPEGSIKSEIQKDISSKENVVNIEPFEPEARTSIMNKSLFDNADTTKFVENNVAPMEKKNTRSMDIETLEPNIQPLESEIISDAKPNDIENSNDLPIDNKVDEQQIHISNLTYDEQNNQPGQYEDNDQMYQENAQLYEQTDQYDSGEQPIEQLYGENGKALHEYDENGQPILPYEQDYNQPSQPQHHTYDENQYNVGQHGIQSSENNDPHYDQNDQHEQPYHEYNQFVPEYDHTQADEQNYGENIQPVQQYDETGQPVQQYDETGQPVQQYDETGQPVQQYDETGQPLQQYNVNDHPNQQFEEKDPTQLYDENGQPNQQYDDQQLLQQYDENGQVLQQQYDENGQPLYFGQGDELAQYDENGQVIQQFDENGQPMQSVYNESYQHYNENGEPVGVYDGQLHEGNGEILQEYQVNTYEEGNHPFGQNVESSEHPQNTVGDVGQDQDELLQNVNPEVVENPNLSTKKKNVLDLLDTDTESMKQNTSKISNDSDFDFSNG